jgi:hypothetical protein
MNVRASHRLWFRTFAKLARQKEDPVLHCPFEPVVLISLLKDTCSRDSHPTPRRWFVVAEAVDTP